MVLKLRSAFVMCVSCALLTACGGSNSPAPGPTTPSGPPTVTLSPASANAFVGQPVMLTWSSTNATSCTASGAWNGSLQTSGSQSVTPVAAGAQTYSIACSGSGGSANASSTITATTPDVSITSSFSPNAVTISTSEGSAFGFEDLWQLGQPSATRLDTQYGFGPTKVTQLYICLSGQVHFYSCQNAPDPTGPLSPAMLAGIDAGIASFARSGMRLLIRFIYSAGESGRDAPIDLIATHIDQLAPILLKNRDLIFALEAGFIGNWGEWHHSTNGNDSDAAHKVILDKELSYFKGVFPILVRYPAGMIAYTGSSSPPDGLGIHDDFYGGGDRDGGTWDPCHPNSGSCLSNQTESQLMTYGEQVSTTSMFVADVGQSIQSLQSCAGLDTYSYRFHLQMISLHLDAGPAVVDFLRTNGCLTSLLNKAGTRIELQKTVLIGNSSANGSMSVGLTLVNAGYGRVVRPRPVTLVFVSNGAVVGQVPISLQDLDLRQLVASAAMTPKTFQFTVTLPASLPTGRAVTVALAIPDPAPSLTPQVVYNLPLNSLDAAGRAIFDATTGYNTIGAFTAGSTTQNSTFTLGMPPPAANLAGAWAGDGPAQPPPPFSVLSLNTAVHGALMRMTGTPRIGWTLTQAGPNVTGSVTVSVAGARVLMGTLTGTYTNGSLGYSVSVPEGAVSFAPGCEGVIDGFATVASTQLDGTAWVRTSSCVAPLSPIGFNLTKQ
jgi:hypothetical protein